MRAISLDYLAVSLVNSLFVDHFCDIYHSSSSAGSVTAILLAYKGDQNCLKYPVRLILLKSLLPSNSSIFRAFKRWPYFFNILSCRHIPTRVSESQALSLSFLLSAISLGTGANSKEAETKYICMTPLNSPLINALFHQGNKLSKHVRCA